MTQKFLRKKLNSILKVAPSFKAFKSFLLVISLLLSLNCIATFAQEEQHYIPESLKPWIEWVKDRHPDLNCAKQGDQKLCSWPGELIIDLNESGGEFKLEINLDSDQLVSLPGSNKTWPHSLSFLSSSKLEPIKSLSQANRPVVWLKAGKHQIAGKFSWQSLPESLAIPKHAALILLSVKGKEIATPLVNEQGELWLKGEAAKDQLEKESITVAVFRKLSDGIPFELTSLIDLRIAGKAREINLGPILPNNAKLINISSKLDYRLNSKGELSIAARPGEFKISIDAVYPSPPAELSAVNNPTDFWPTEEIWVWTAMQTLRSVELTGLPSIDPDRTSLPSNWKGLPTYLAKPNSKLSFKETRRGQLGSSPNSVNISRRFLLGLDAKGYSIQDNLSGKINQTWRLNLLPEYTPGKISVSGKQQVITADSKNALPGVELREQTLNLQAESQLRGSRTKFKATGWDVDADSLSISLNLPPGWTLLDAKGADTVSNSWISTWNLLKIFLLVIIVVLSFKLLGFIPAFVILALLIFSHNQQGAAFQVWFHLLAATGLLSVLPTSKFKLTVKIYYSLCLGYLVLTSIPYIIVQVQTAIFPQLGSRNYLNKFDISQEILLLVIGAGFLALLPFFLAEILKGFKKGKWLLSIIKLLVIGPILLGALGLAFISFSGIRPGAKRMYFGDSLQQGTNVAISSPMDESLGTSNYRKDLYRAEEKAEAPASYQKRRAKVMLLNQVDPKAQVQTGHGIPTWSWKTWHLGWRGPVAQDQEVKLFLIGPKLNLLLTLGRVVLLLLMLVFFSRSLQQHWKKGALSAFFLLFSLAFSFTPLNVQAEEFPDKNLLTELESKLSKAVCEKDCVFANKLEIAVEADNSVLIEANVSSHGTTAFPLPGPLSELRINQVLLDGIESKTLRREADNMLWLRLEDGRHSLQIKGRLVKQNITTLQFGIQPGYVSVQAPNWKVDGLSSRGEVKNSIQLIKEIKTASQIASQDKSKQDLANWFLVYREINLGSHGNLILALSV